jgi:uncharacterized membrane protein HdeD (DUF308 family)
MTNPVTVPTPSTSDTTRKVSNLFTVEGVILVILGIIAVLLPVIATFAFTVMLGCLFIISGGVGLYTTLSAKDVPGYWWAILSAILALAAGVVMIIWPVAGALSLTFVLITFFLLEGFVTIFYSLEHRSELGGRWVFMLISGIVTLLLAIMIMLGLPATAIWALGLLAGIDMIFGGVALIAMASAARRTA